MNEITKKILGLRGMERNVFIGGFYGKKDLETAVHLALADAAPEARAEYLKGLPAGLTAATWQETPAVLPADKLAAAAAELERRLGGLSSEMEKMQARSAAAVKKTVRGRADLRSGFMKLDTITSDQELGLERGPLQKEPQGEAVELPRPDKNVLRKTSLFDCIADRKSVRKFSEDPLTLAELGYLLWATQGLRRLVPGRPVAFRTVPSGGCLHPLETYIAAHNVAGLPPGLYYYQPLNHRLVRLAAPADLRARVIKAARMQRFVGECAATFLWSAVPYRTEWRYSLEAKKMILQDSGHVCQNLYLACESIGCGTCGIGAYNQKLMDKLCGLDGRDELVVYAAPVGRAP